MKRPYHTSAALTGCGWVTPRAHGSIEDVLTGLTSVDPPQAQPTAPQIVPDDPPPFSVDGFAKELRRGKGAWMAAYAIEAACRTASLALESVPGERIGLTVGCGLAGVGGMLLFADEVRSQSGRFVSPIHFPQTVGNYVAGALARAYGVRGPNMTFASGPGCSVDALREAAAMVARGGADVVLAGGYERLPNPSIVAELGYTDSSLAEGSCFFVVERSERAAARSVRPLALMLESGDDGADAGPSKIDSTVYRRLPGAVFIEHRAGLCLGAAGAAAAAAAIGAARGAAVPRVDANASDSIGFGVFPIDKLRGPDGTVVASIHAPADSSSSSGVTRLRLAIPPAA